MIADRPFVNNASFGAYAEIVQSPEYRDNKKRTMLEMLPDLLSADSTATLTVRAGGTTLTGEQAVLVSNNPYGAGKLRDMGRRARIDQRHPRGDHRAPGQRRAGGQRAPECREGADRPAPRRCRGDHRRRQPGPSRSASTARPSPWTPRCTAPSDRGRCGFCCPGTVPASPNCAPNWTGKRCGDLAFGRSHQ